VVRTRPSIAFRVALPRVLTCAAIAAGIALPASALGSTTASPSCTAAPYDCAVALVEQHEFTAAVTILERVLSQTPSNLKALNLLGIALTGAGRVTEGNAAFEKALAIDARFNPARKNLAINEFNRGRLSVAERQLTRVVAEAATDEVAHLYLAEISVRKRACGKAIAHYAKAGRYVATRPEFTLHHGGCLLETGAIVEGMALLETLPPDASAQRFDAAVAIGRAKQYAEAARWFAALRGSYRDPYAAGYNQLLMLINGGDYQAAATLADQLLAAEPPRAELQSLAAQAFAKAGRVKEAYDALRVATVLEPTNQEHYLDLAAICTEHENYDLGLEIVDIGLQKNPASWVLQLQRGVLWAMKAQLVQAEEAFDTARRMVPARSAPYAALAMVWMQTGRTPKAVETLRAESRRRKRDHVVPYMFAVALIRSGVDPTTPEALEAVTALRASIAANATFAPAHSELGRLLLKRDDVDGAIEELEQATQLDPEATAALYNLAQAYRRKGDRDRAAELLARVNKLNVEKRGDDPERELRQIVVRIVREGSAPQPAGAP
jgi:tetratricopeptide (TPR) repeat protein